MSNCMFVKLYDTLDNLVIVRECALLLLLLLVLPSSVTSAHTPRHHKHGHHGHLKLHLHHHWIRSRCVYDHIC